MKEVGMDFLGEIIRANNVKDKGKNLKEASQLLEILRVYVRLCYDLNLFGMKQYEIVSKRMDEIGRMLGGWLKGYRENV